MSDSRIANWLSGGATLVAAATLLVALVQHNNKEKDDEVSRWQRVLIHKVISEKNGVTFNDLKVRYVAESTQLQAFKLPAKEIQDDALRFNLLELQKDRLITLSQNGLYRPYIEAPTFSPDILMSMLKTQSDRNDIFYIQRPKIMRLLEQVSGQYTVEELYQRVRDAKIEVSEEDFYNLISSLRADRFINRDERGRLSSTYDIDSPPELAPQK